MLSKILELQKIGRFERLESARITFTRVMLIFGENGWGKSTLADIFRSVATGRSDILCGRETLATSGVQKVRLLFDKQHAVFSGNTWSGHKPSISIYDQCFINDNVYSGDAVSLDHLKRQYGIVIGERGVYLVRSIEELTTQVTGFDQAFRAAETVITTALRAAGITQTVTLKDFVLLQPDEGIAQLIAEKDKEIALIEKAAEIGRLGPPELLPVPSDAAAFRQTLAQGIDDVAAGAHHALHAHIARHSGSPPAADKPKLSHEEWIEAGLHYQTSDHCAFCGQYLTDHTLVNIYKVFFGEHYKALAAEIRQRRATLQRYLNGDFKRQVQDRIKQNTATCQLWEALAGIAAPPFSDGVEDMLLDMEQYSATIDRFCEQKQGDLIRIIAHPELDAALNAWNERRTAVVRLNADIEAHRAKLAAAREKHATMSLEQLQKELAVLHARRLRSDPALVAAIGSRATADLNKTHYTAERNRRRAELTLHSIPFPAVWGK